MKLRTQLLHAVLLFLLLPMILLAQGKIRGRVNDKQTKEPLVGANVIVVGTTYGAASGPSGEFVILNVPVGTFTLRVSYIGFSAYTIENVRVNFQLTTDVLVELTPEQISLAPVIIVAERPLINKSSTNATRIATGEDMQNTPVRGLNELIALQAGVTLQDGNLHIRGGRVDETGFYLEGVSITDPQYGGRGLTLVQDALEEVSVQAAGYEAEFGRANAGIIQHQLRTGGDSWRGTLEYVTDNVGFQSKKQAFSGTKRLGAYWYGYNEVTGTLGGPLIDERFKFFGMLNYNYQRDRHPQEWPGVNLGPIKDPISGDSIDFVYPAGPLQRNSRERYASTATLTVDLRPLMLKFSGSYAKTKDNLKYTGIFDADRGSEGNTTDGFGSLKATYFFNSTTYAEFSGGFFKYFYKEFDPALRDDFFAYGDRVANADAGYGGTWRPYNQTGRYITQDFPTFPRIFIWYFYPSGFPSAQYLKFNRYNISLNAAFSAQIGKSHTLKLGGDYQRYTIRTYQIGYPAGLADVIHKNANKPDTDQTKITTEQIMIQNAVNNYGYDIFGNLTNSDNFLGPRHPVFGSAYIQDKMDYGDLILNVGLRYDYMNSNSTPMIDSRRPELTINYNTFAINDSTGIAKSTPFQTVSPRLGAAFPVSDRTVFHVQYAKLVQMTQMRDVNLGLYRLRPMMAYGGSSTPIGFDLKPERTTQYEIGFAQQLGSNASLDVTGFYKDIRDQIVVRLMVPATGSPYVPYSVYVNGDFATTKGLELAFTMRRIKRLQLNASLSFQDAEGSGSFPNSNRGMVLAGLDTTYFPQYVSPLSFNEAIRGSVNVDYRFGRDDGGLILQNVGASLLFTFNSGHPYTSIIQQSAETDATNRMPNEALNSSTTPWVFQCDLRLDKTFWLVDRFKVNLYLLVINLFGAKNITNVFLKTGSADDNGVLSNPTQGGQRVTVYGSQYADLYRAMNIDYGRPVGTYNDPYFYGAPRQIRLGLRLEY